MYKSAFASKFFLDSSSFSLLIELSFSISLTIIGFSASCRIFSFRFGNVCIKFLTLSISAELIKSLGCCFGGEKFVSPVALKLKAYNKKAESIIKLSTLTECFNKLNLYFILPSKCTILNILIILSPLALSAEYIYYYNQYGIVLQRVC